MDMRIARIWDRLEHAVAAATTGNTKDRVPEGRIYKPTRARMSLQRVVEGGKRVWGRERHINTRVGISSTMI
jgi:hypothetical protein